MIWVEHQSLGEYRFAAELKPDGCIRQSKAIFTDNNTTMQAIFGTPNSDPYVKDAFHRYVVHGEDGAVNPQETGTKAAVHYVLEIPPGQQVTVRCRLFAADQTPHRAFGTDFDSTFALRLREADEFYATHISPILPADDQGIARQGYAGLLRRQGLARRRPASAQAAAKPV